MAGPSGPAFLYNFYPRSPCGERRVMPVSLQVIPLISIHALLAESDVCTTTTTICIVSFLSTLSLRRATIDTSKDVIKTANFYPRSPCGERPVTTVVVGPSRDFYPRSPCGERPWWLRCWQLAARDISIHALLAESDVLCLFPCRLFLLFLSTLSLRRATGECR